MALVVDGHGAPAGAEAKLIADELDHGGVGAIFPVKPVMKALTLHGGEAREPGIATGFARRA